jgi:hypothetical protein
MKTKMLLERLKGTQTIESIMAIMHANRQKAIYYIFRLRKKGYVKTKRQGNKRVYYISFENKLGGTSYLEIINKSAPMKIRESSEAGYASYRIYGKEPSPEETLIYAIKTKSLRTILASLALFKKIHDWARLYNLAKQEGLERQAGALYDLARRIIRTRKMTKRFLSHSLPKKQDKYMHIIGKLSSKDFKDIEKKWRVYLPFNMADLEDYKSNKQYDKH